MTLDTRPCDIPSKSQKGRGPGNEAKQHTESHHSRLGRVDPRGRVAGRGMTVAETQSPDDQAVGCVVVVPPGVRVRQVVSGEGVET